MSGPKVVRVVTREERMAEANAMLARLTAGLVQWQALQDEVVPGEEATVLARHQQITSLLDTDRFDDFQLAASREVAFLSEEVARRRERAVLRRAEALVIRLRTGQNADALLQALASKGIALDETLRGALEAARSGRADRNTASQALAAGLRLLAPVALPHTATDAQTELARRLMAPGEDLALSEWQASFGDVTADSRIDHIARQLETLRQLLGDDAVGGFSKQLDEAVSERDGVRRSMRLDSVLVGVSSAAQSAREWATSLAEGRTWMAELARMGGDEALALQAQLQRRCADARDLTGLKAQIGVCQAFVALAKQAAAARSRRDVVLKGLASLGYEVNEGMETSWVADGRLVVRKPGLEGYGVELSGAPAAERLQVRAVALRSARDTSRDLGAEQQWCDDFSQLAQGLAQAGSQLHIDKAMPVGAVPLKVVAVPESGAQDRRGMAAPSRKMT